MGPCGPSVPLLGLAPAGVCRAPDSRERGGGLLPHRFTLARTHQASPGPYTLASRRLATMKVKRSLGRWRSLLCGTFQGSLLLALRRAACPAESGLSSPGFAWTIRLRRPAAGEDVQSRRSLGRPSAPLPPLNYTTNVISIIVSCPLCA